MWVVWAFLNVYRSLSTPVLPVLIVSSILISVLETQAVPVLLLASVVSAFPHPHIFFSEHMHTGVVSDAAASPLPNNGPCAQSLQAPDDQLSCSFQLHIQHSWKFPHHHLHAVEVSGVAPEWSALGMLTFWKKKKYVRQNCFFYCAFVPCVCVDIFPLLFMYSACEIKLGVAVRGWK